MHPVIDIAKAFEVVIKATAPQAKVHLFLARTLSEEQGDLPSYAINIGRDSPVPSLNTLDGLIGSSVEITVTVRDANSDERVLVEAMAAHRLLVHSAVMPPGSLNLSCPYEVEYGGADEISVNGSNRNYQAEYVLRFQVTHQVNRNNPTV